MEVSAEVDKAAILSREKTPNDCRSETQRADGGETQCTATEMQQDTRMEDKRTEEQTDAM